MHSFPSNQVYAPQRLQLDPLRDLRAISGSMREAYEAAAMGPRGACLKEQGGAEGRWGRWGDGGFCHGFIAVDWDFV